MRYKTQDLRIAAEKELTKPSELIRKFSLNEQDSQFIHNSREAIKRIITGDDKRLMVVVGPCSIHDVKAAKEYACLLKEVKETYKDSLLLVMRTYFEKPRTTIGWKGLINDPDLDETFNINKGFYLARELLHHLCQSKIPSATEYLDLITPQYLSDLICWSAIGARTTESQTHRQLASGLSTPVGFKNSTTGDVQVAVDAVRSANFSHTFLSSTLDGKAAIFTSRGNRDCHIILRGGKGGTNYDADSISQAVEKLKSHQLNPRLMVDFSHANSQKKPSNQILVAQDIATQIKKGQGAVFGVMIESNLVEGNQPISNNMTYGQSITDACLNWQDTIKILDTLKEAQKFI